MSKRKKKRERERDIIMDYKCSQVNFQKIIRKMKIRPFLHVALSYADSSTQCRFLVLIELFCCEKVWQIANRETIFWGKSYLYDLCSAVILQEINPWGRFLEHWAERNIHRDSSIQFRRSPMPNFFATNSCENVRRMAHLLNFTIEKSTPGCCLTQKAVQLTPTCYAPTQTNIIFLLPIFNRN